MDKIIMEFEQHRNELESALILMYSTMNNTKLFNKLLQQKLDLEYDIAKLKKEYENE